MGRTIRELRKITGLTQQQFASKFEIPYYSVIKWERGASTPPPYIAKLIEKILVYEGKVNEND